MTVKTEVEHKLPISVRNPEECVKVFNKVTGHHKYIARVRWDDTCKNGHNSFAITCYEYSKSKAGTWIEVSGGCNHDLVIQHFPELAPFLKFHLCSSDGPMHYIANTVFLASDKDCWGFRKGEQVRTKEGELVWDLVTLVNGKPLDRGRVYGDTPHVEYQLNPVLGEGKGRDLEPARKTACWPEASDEVLMLPADELEKKLIDRLPALMIEFKAAVESLGFVY